MAPRNYRSNTSVKTYSRNVPGNRTTLDVLHNILTNPIQKKKARGKRWKVIKELPPARQQTCFSNSSESSLKLNINCDNTFDKLLNGTRYNNVPLKALIQNKNSSESSLSKIEIQISRYSRPVRQKRIRKEQKYRSPIMTRSFCRKDGTSSSIDDKKVRTLEKSVHEILCVEKAKTTVQEPTIHFGASDGEKSKSVGQLQECGKENNVNTPYETIFSKTFQEKYRNVPKFVHIENAVSSTPIGMLGDQKLINETIISPIDDGSDRKVDVKLTPKIKRVSKARKSRLIDNMNGDNTSSEYLTHKTNDLSKIVDNSAVVLHIDNESRNDLKLSNLKPLVNVSVLNLSNLNCDPHHSESVITNKRPIVNITAIDIEKYSNKILGGSTSDLKSEIASFRENNVEKISQQPFVYLNKIDIENHLNLPTSISCRDVHGKRFTKNKANDKQITDDNCISYCAGINNIDENKKSITLHTSLINFFGNPLVDLTNIDIAKRLIAKSPSEGVSTMENTSVEMRSSCSTQDSSEESTKDVKYENLNEFVSDLYTNPSVYVTLRRRRVLRNINISKSLRNSKSKSKNSNSSGDISNLNLAKANSSDSETNLSADVANTSRTNDSESDSIQSIRKIDTRTHVSENISADLFPGLDSSEVPIATIQTPNENVTDEVNTSVVNISRKFMNLIDSSLIDTSCTELLDNKNRRCAIFSLRNSKRRRNSKLAWGTAICQDIPYDNRSLSSSFDFIEHTPISVIKRRKISDETEVDASETIQSIITDHKENSFDLTSGKFCNDIHENSSTPISSVKSLEVERQSLLSNIDSVIEILDEDPSMGMENRDDIRESATPETTTIQDTEPIIIEEQKKEGTTMRDRESIIEDYTKESRTIRDTKSVIEDDGKENRMLTPKIFAVPKTPRRRKPVKPAVGELVLKSGKSWRRSLLEVRNSKIGLPTMRRSWICVANQGDAACACTMCKRKIMEKSTPRRLSVRVVPLPAAREIVAGGKRNTVLADYAVSCRQSYISDVLHESLLEECLENLSLNGRNPKLLDADQEEYNDCREGSVTARDVVFRKCGQTEPLPFEKCYPNSVLQHCQKIGEGVYGEVFLFRRPLGGTSVIKVIPIEGDLIVNGERQKKFEEILSEITIAMELSGLRHGAKNYTDCFSDVRKATCVKGKYPARLVELWELYEESRRTENDHPDIFEENQLFIVLELANGGNDMESFVFANAQQAYALVTQVACALAVAESSLQFEHRDLHWGNILISNVDNDQTVSFSIDGKDVTLDTFGVRIAIIDFTLSRICSDGVCIYNDLGLDPELFTAQGDYQFDIYRLMREQNGNEWQHYEPYTNILWLHYVLDKAIKAIHYRRKTTKIHRKYLKNLKELKDEVLQYKSAGAFVTAKFVDV